MYGKYLANFFVKNIKNENDENYVSLNMETTELFCLINKMLYFVTKAGQESFKRFNTIAKKDVEKKKEPVQSVKTDNAGEDEGDEEDEGD